MVFSQTSQKTHSVLKVVDLDRLKEKKAQQVNGLTGVIAGGELEVKLPCQQSTTTSFSEEFLKLEPAYDSTMFHDSDCEFFQDLVQWCSDPVKEEQVQTIDPRKVIEERALNNNSLHTPVPLNGWEVFNDSSPAPAGTYPITPIDPLSPTVDGFDQFSSLLSPDIGNHNKMQNEEFLDFNNMPVVFGDLDPEKLADTNPVQTAGLIDWEHIHAENVNSQITMPFDDTEESKFASVISREMQSNDVVITDVIYGSNVENEAESKGGGVEKRQGLTVSIPVRSSGWPADLISTPDIVSCVEQMEKETSTLLSDTAVNDWPDGDTNAFVSSDVHEIKTKVDYEPITPKSESHADSDNDNKPYKKSRKRRYDSDDSDETYIPYEEPTRRKYTKRKPNIPIKDMIKALEGSQPTKAKRGRPPKRRESNVSSICSVDDNSSNVSSHENKYRELRDKNNEASKRSRMNRKLKELQMEQLELDLEEKNKKLKIKADILEDMTKRLKDALMTAILNKK